MTKKPLDEKAQSMRREVLKVFKELRQEGFIARANFSCCAKCAEEALVATASTFTLERASKVKGFVFWHHGDERALAIRGFLQLSYGPLNTAAHGVVGRSHEEVGQYLVKKLKSRGLRVTWPFKNARFRIIVLTA